MSGEIPQKDSTEEAAAIRRLATASKNTGDEPTGDAAIVRAIKLGHENGFDPLSPEAVQILNIKETPHQESPDD